MQNKLAQEKVAAIFKGMIVANYTRAIFNFKKNTSIQKILHQLKYQNQKKMGKNIAEWFLAENDQNLAELKIFDAVVPVPISKRKKRKRGYNQLETFGKHLATALKIPYENRLLQCKNNKTSQTKKTQWERFENVKSAFFTGKNTPEKLPYKKILLIDDVLTTGATSLRCATLLQEKWPVETGLLFMAANV